MSTSTPAAGESRGEAQLTAAFHARPATPADAPLDVLIGELGDSLDSAFADRARARPRRARAIAAIALLVAALSTSAWLLSRPPGGADVATPPPRATGIVARGISAGVAWALAVRGCAARGRFALALVTTAGSSATACGATTSRPATTFFDETHAAALAFGVVPAGTQRVQVGASGGGQVATRIARLVPRSGSATPSRGAVVFVARIPYGQIATATTAFGAASRLLEACNQRRCVAP